MKFLKFVGGSVLLLFMAGIIVSLQGCLKSEDGYNAWEFYIKDIETIQKYLDANGINAEFDSMAGVFIEVHKQGDGYKTVQDTDIEIHYQGMVLEGAEFVNSFGGSPITLQLGNSGTYPPPFTDGIALGLFRLREGDSATVYVPSPLGFRDEGYSNSVPPNSILVYNTKFVQINNLHEDITKIDQYLADKNLTAEVDPDYGTRYIIHERSTNDKMPEFGDQVTLHYVGTLLNDTVFDSSWGKVPLTFTMGKKDVVIGFELGVTNLHKKDSATFFIPSIYGYKDQAVGPIPSNSVLIFGVKILDILKALP